MSWFDLFVLALATNALVEYWLRGSLFHPTRAWLENNPYGETVSEFLSCGLCMSPWVALALFALSCIHLQFVLWVFAAARLANLARDLWPLSKSKMP